jgi:lambda family phage portal protein
MRKKEGELAALRDEVTQLRIQAFEAAKQTRRTEGWFATSSGPNSDLKAAWWWLVKRHQSLVDDEPLASRAISVIVQNWIGDGIMSKPMGATKKYERSFKNWAESLECDFYGLSDWYGLQSIIARTTAVRGACIVRKRVHAPMMERGLVPLQLQVLEPDWLDFNKDNGTDILFGQQFDADGRLMGYWLRDSHPGETVMSNGVRITSTFVPKEEIILHFDCRRPGQRMGIPFGVAAILTLRDMGDIRAAQQMKDKIAACFAGFIIDSEPAEAGSTTGIDFDSLEPGAVEHLPPGKDIRFAVPPGAGDFVATHKEYAHAVAVAYDVTYESLTGDLSDVNYSSFRGGWLEFARRVLYLQGKVTTPQLLNPVCRWHDDLARMTGALRGNVSWLHTPPRREMIDPSKEIPMILESVQGGLMSLSEAHRMLGRDPEEVFAEYQQDLERWKGIPLAAFGSLKPTATV